MGLTMVLAGSLLARSWVATTRPLWHDEIFTVFASRLPDSGLLHVLQWDSGPPLFYRIERPWVALAESVGNDVLARVPSFVAALLLFLGAASLPRGGGRGWFLVLLAFSPLLLAYSAEARAYTLLALLDFLLFLLLFRSKPTPLTIAGAAAGAVTALWTHYLALFFVATCGFLLIAQKRWKPLAALGIAGLLFLPWLPILLAQPRQATAWMHETLGPSLLGLLSTLGGAGRIPNPLGGPLPAFLVWVGAGIGVGLLAAIAAAARRDSALAVAAALSVGTIALVFVASLDRPTAFSGRTEMAILPIWLWAIARSAPVNVAVRWLGAGAATLALTASIVLATAPRPDPTPAVVADLVTEMARPDDQVIAAAALYLPIRLAHDRGRLRADLTSLPPDLALHPGWVAAEPLREDDYEKIERALSVLPPGRRLFLLLNPVFQTPRLDRIIRQGGSVKPLLQRPDALVLACTAR